MSKQVDRSILKFINFLSTGSAFLFPLALVGSSVSRFVAESAFNFSAEVTLFVVASAQHRKFLLENVPVIFELAAALKEIFKNLEL